MNLKSSSAFRSEHSFHHHSRSSSPACPMELFGSFARPHEPMGFPGKSLQWDGGEGAPHFLGSSCSPRSPKEGGGLGFNTELWEMSQFWEGIIGGKGTS